MIKHMRKILFTTLLMGISLCAWCDDTIEFTLFGKPMGTPMQEMLDVLQAQTDISLTATTSSTNQYAGKVRQYGLDWTTMTATFAEDRLFVVQLAHTAQSKEEHNAIVQQIKEKYGYLLDAVDNEFVRSIFGKYRPYGLWARSDGHNVIIYLNHTTTMLLAYLCLDVYTDMVAEQGLTGYNPAVGIESFPATDLIFDMEGLEFRSGKKEVEQKADALWKPQAKGNHFDTYTDAVVDGARYDKLTLRFESLDDSQAPMFVSALAQKRFAANQKEEALAFYEQLRSHYNQLYTRETYLNKPTVKEALYGAPDPRVAKATNRPIHIDYVESEEEGKTSYIIRLTYAPSETINVPARQYPTKGAVFNIENTPWFYRITSDDEPFEAEVIQYSGDMQYMVSRVNVPASTMNPDNGISYAVVGIGDEAMDFGYPTTSVTFPSTLRYIGNRNHFGERVKSITLPASLTRLGIGCFSECDSLQTIKLEDGNRHFVIENGALYTRSKDTLVAYPTGKSVSGLAISSSTKAIAPYVFANAQVRSVTIPSSVKTIGDSAFYNCRQLTSVEMPNSVTEIGVSAFEGCYQLASMRIPAGLTEIKRRAFAMCAMSSIDIPNQVRIIGDEAFSGNQGATSITIPASVDSIGLYAFVGMYYLNNVYVNWARPDQLPRTAPDIFEGQKIRSVAVELHTPKAMEETYRNSPVWEDFVIGGIPPHAKVGDQFEAEGIPYEVISTEPREVAVARQEYSGTSCTIPATVKDARDTYTVTALGSGAFYTAAKLTSVSLPATLRTIDERAFVYCTELRSIALPKSVNHIGNYAFAGCTNLVDITIPWGKGDKLPTVDEMAFASIGKDQGPAGVELHIPNGTKDYYRDIAPWNGFKVGGAVLFQPKPVEEKQVEVVEVTKVDTVAFLKASGWVFVRGQKFTVNGIRYEVNSDRLPTVRVIARKFYSDSVYVIPSLVTKNDTTYMVTEIGKLAFEASTHIKKMTIPSTVTTLSMGAFEGCENLLDIYVSWTKKADIPSGDNMFQQMFRSLGNWQGPKAATLHVPQGTKALYEQMPQWQDFGTIVEDIVVKE